MSSSALHLSLAGVFPNLTTSAAARRTGAVRAGGPLRQPQENLRRTLTLAGTSALASARTGLVAQRRRHVCRAGADVALAPADFASTADPVAAEAQFLSFCSALLSSLTAADSPAPSADASARTADLIADGLTRFQANPAAVTAAFDALYPLGAKMRPEPAPLGTERVLRACAGALEAHPADPAVLAAGWRALGAVLLVTMDGDVLDRACAVGLLRAAVAALREQPVPETVRAVGPVLCRLVDGSDEATAAAVNEFGVVDAMREAMLRRIPLELLSKRATAEQAHQLITQFVGTAGSAGKVEDGGLQTLANVLAGTIKYRKERDAANRGGCR